MVKTTIVNQTGIITFNRPDKRNALNSALVVAIKDKLSEFAFTDSIKSVILTGEGKAFCAGADMEYLLELKKNTLTDNRKDSRNLAELFLSVSEFPKPVIAAVNGPAIAGGCGLASVCDFVVAHKNYAKFGYSETRIGFIPAIVSIFIIKRIGEGKARQLLLSAEIIDAEKAYAIGLADYLSDDPLKTALEISLRLNENSASSLMLTKQMIHNISSMGVKEAVDYCMELNALSRSTDDFIKGLNKFLNK